MNEFNTNREIVLSNTTSSSFATIKGDEVTKDMRYYRPMEVSLTIVLLDLQAELTTVSLFLFVWILTISQ